MGKEFIVIEQNKKVFLWKGVNNHSDQYSNGLPQGVSFSATAVTGYRDRCRLSAR
jgi:hypothetical protein